MKKSAQARIIAMGSYLPTKVLSNQDLEAMVETSDEWIVSRTGIKERRVAGESEFTSTMGTEAALKALQNAKMSPDEIEFIIVATLTPDFISTSTAALIQGELAAKNAAAMDIQAACTGFLYALSTAKAYIDAGIYKNILVIASEKMTAYVDYTDRNTCVLFGDGAAAAIISHEGEGLLIETVSLGSDGKLSHLINIPAGGVRLPSSDKTLSEKLHYFKMEGKEVFKHAVRHMQASAEKCLAIDNLTIEDISWLVPHQANLRIIDAVAKCFQLPAEKIYKTVHKYGNTSASSIPIALSELTTEQKLLSNEKILLVAFGAGLTWGAALLRKVIQ